MEDLERGFTISPNPTGGLINIELTKALEEKNNHFEWYRLTGEKINTFQVNGTSNSFDLGHFESGVYLLKFVNEDRSFIRRVVKY